MSHPLPVLTLSELCGLRLVLTGGRKTNGEVTEQRRENSLTVTFQSVDEGQQLVQTLSQ